MRQNAFFAAAVVVVVSGWARTPTAPLSPTGRPPAFTPAEWTIGMSQCNLGEPWRVQMNADIRKAAEGHPELKVIYKDAQNDSLRPVAHVEEFVKASIDAIIISPKEAAPLTPPVTAAYKYNGLTLDADATSFDNHFEPGRTCQGILPLDRSATFMKSCCKTWTLVVPPQIPAGWQ